MQGLYLGKMYRKTIVALSLFSTLFGCGPKVSFTEPMPPGEKDLSKIPLRYRGDYINDDGSVFIHIDNKIIVKEYDYNIRIHRDSMTFWDSLSGDTLWDKYVGSSRVVSIDSNGFVSYHVNEEETVFAMDLGHQARKFKGRLFLNYPWGESNWTVEQVQLQKGILTFGTISSQAEIEALNESVENTSDTVATTYSPTKKQFKSFVKSEGFGYDEQYHRIR